MCKNVNIILKGIKLDKNNKDLDKEEYIKNILIEKKYNCYTLKEILYNKDILKDKSLFEFINKNQVGFPDFLIEKNYNNNFCEIKDYNDGLKIKQIRWLENLRKYGFNNKYILFYFYIYKTKNKRYNPNINIINKINSRFQNLTKKDKMIIRLLNENQIGLNAYEMAKELEITPKSVYNSLKRLREHNFIEKIDTIFRLNLKVDNEICFIPIRCPKCETLQYVYSFQNTKVCDNINCKTKTNKRTRFYINPKKIDKNGKVDLIIIKRGRNV